MAVNWLDQNQIRAWRDQEVAKSPNEKAEIDAYVDKKIRETRATQPGIDVSPQVEQKPKGMLEDLVEGRPDEGFVEGMARNVLTTMTGMPRMVAEAGRQTYNQYISPEFHEISAKIDDGSATEEELQRFIELNSGKYIRDKEMEQISGKPLKGALLGGKKGLGTAASFVPGLGPEATVAQTALRSGIAGSMAGAGQEQDELSVGGTLGQAAVGFGAGAILGGAFKMIGNTWKWIKGGKEIVANDVTKNLLKMTDKQYRDAIDHGLDPVKVSRDFFTENPNATWDDFLTKKTGIFDKTMSEAEKQITATRKIAGTNQRVGGEDIIANLKKEYKILSSKLGDETKAKALKKIIEQAEKKYANGTTVNKALDTVRYANKKFGKGIIETTKGAVATSAQKVEANALKNSLKVNYPEVAEALRIQETIYAIRPMFEKASSTFSRTATTKGATINPFDLFGIPEVVGRNLNQPQIMSKVISPTAGDVVGPALDALTPQAPIAATAGAVTSMAGGGEETPPALGQEPEISPRVAEITGQGMAGEEAVPGVSVNYKGTEIDRAKLYELRMANIDNKGASKILNIIDDRLTEIEAELEVDDEMNVGKVTAADFQKAITGSKSLNDFEDIIYTSDGRLNRDVIMSMKTPGGIQTQEARQASTALYRVAESFLRLDTGAAAPPEEIQRLAEALEPRITDSVDTIRARMTVYRNTYDAINKIANQKKGISLDEISQ